MRPVFLRRPAAAASIALLGFLAPSGPVRATPATFDCIMEASLVVKVGSPVASTVTDVDVDRGDVVKKGQVLAHIESSVEQAAVDYGRAKMDSMAEIAAKQAVLDQKAGVLRRKLGLQEAHVGTSQEVENAQAEFNVAKQELALANLNHHMAEIELGRAQAEVELRTIRSPIDGVVTQRMIGPGEFFHQESTIVTMARVDPLNVETYLPVSYFQRVKVGDIAVVHPAAPVGGERPAKLTVVDQVFDAASGTFGVRLELANKDGALPAGLRCRITFDPADPAPQASANAQP